MAKPQEILDQISELKVLELSELVKLIEDKFNVSASAPAMVAGMAPLATAGAAETEATEEKTEFDVKLIEIGSNKIAVIKAVRELTQLGLKEAKDFVESAPKVLKEAVPKEEAEETKKKLEQAGAKAEVN